MTNAAGGGAGKAPKTKRNVGRNTKGKRNAASKMTEQWKRVKKK